MRGAGAGGAGLGAGRAGLAAILASTWDRPGLSSRWCWITAFRLYPAEAPRMTAMADAVIRGRRRGRRRPSRALGMPGRSAPAGAGSDRGPIADWAAVTLASS